ncbi:unnamed protein product [Polarella glacialis]|uniref:Uncharacterized protein n=2 Tax=Polarella glacialis TaxID=89957 RepID=A0A813GNN5_POLGL|nr:unnamed protein product [Polarella glacialis]
MASSGCEPAPPITEEEASAGFQFVRELMRDISTLHSGLTGLRDQTAQLRADLEREQTSRKDDTSTLRRDMVRSVADEAKLRADFQTRSEAFQNQAKQGIGDLRKDATATKERVDLLDLAMEKRISKASEAEERLSKLENQVELRSTIADFNDLSARVAGLQADVVRDRASAAMTAKGLLGTEARLDALQQQTKATTQALDSNVSSLFAKVGALQALAQTLANAKDLELLEGRMVEVSSLKSVSDRVTEMAMEAHTQQTRMQTLTDNFTSKISNLDKDSQKLDRLAEQDRERTSSCIVALEKELSNRAPLSDVNSLGSRVSTASSAVQRLELMATGKVSIDDFEKLRARADIMEVTLIKKADNESLGKTSQAQTEQARGRESCCCCRCCWCWWWWWCWGCGCWCCCWCCW